MASGDHHKRENDPPLSWTNMAKKAAFWLAVCGLVSYVGASAMKYTSIAQTPAQVQALDKQFLGLDKRVTEIEALVRENRARDEEWKKATSEKLDRIDRKLDRAFGD